MPGPYVLSAVDVANLSMPPPKDAVVPAADQAGGVQCVGLVKYYTKCGGTGTWKKGAMVKDSPQLKAGTAIATFDSQGRYPSHKSGNHACFFLRFMPGNKGITVLEQHVMPNKNKIQTRNILYRQGKGTPSDDASAYAVIL
ncbi:MAG: BPSL0067 family protein [Spirochaetia bacterium]